MSECRLPVEMLEEILSRMTGRIELYVHQDHYSVPESRYPWNLALVCKIWRDIVLSTPNIWSNISLKGNPKEQTGHNDTLLSTLKLCLDRSGSHPLTIELISSKGEPSSQILAFLKPLMEHAQRWETVTFSASHDTLLPYLSNYPVQYTRLRHLRIDNGFRQTKENWVGLFQDAPMLSCVSLNRLSFHSQRLGRVGIPWSQISHLQVHARFGCLDDLMDILKNTPNLVTLEYSTSYNYPDQGRPRTLKLLHLQRLVWTSNYDEFNDEDGPATPRFFQLLRAPQLSVLEVNGVCGGKELKAIHDCLRRSKCSVTSLKLPTLASPPDSLNS